MSGFKTTLSHGVSSLVPMKKKDAYFLLLLLALALALRLFRIGSQSIWIDEMLTLNVSIPKPGLTIWDYLKYNIHGALHALLIYLAHFVSTSDAWLRLPSALAGVGAVYFLYRWFLVWVGREVARVASVLLVINPLHVYYSQEIRNYSLLFLFATFSSYLLHRLLAEERVRHYALYILSMAAGALCNFTMFFLYVAHSVIYLARRGKVGRRLLTWILVSLAIAILISPWIYRVGVVIDFTKLFTPVAPGDIPTADRIRGETTVTPVAVPYAFYAFSVGYSLGPSLRELHKEATLSYVFREHRFWVSWVTLLFGSIFLAGVYRLSRGPQPLWQVALYLGTPVVLTLLICWQNAKAFNVRYVLLALPAYLCVVAAGVGLVRARFRAIVALALGVTALAALGNYYFNGDYARANVRQAVWDVRERAQPGDCILAPTVSEIVAHYYEEVGRVHVVSARAGTPKAQVDGQIDSLVANCNRIWYVRAREWVDDPEGYVPKALALRMLQKELMHYDGVTVFHFERTD